MALALRIAVTHILARKRQTLVSLSGIVLGTAFFLAVSALMRGSEQDFIKRLIDNSPHITVSDDFRSANLQPAEERWPDAVIAIQGVKPQREVRGIRNYREKLRYIESIDGLRVAPVLTGSVVLTFAGRVQGMTVNGVVPATIVNVTTIEEKLTAGSLAALTANPNGIVVGQGLIDKFRLAMGRNLTVATSEGVIRTLKIVGIFRTGNAGVDETQGYVLLKRAQTLLDRPNRVNRFIIQLDNPYRARDVARQIEQRIGYKSLSWIEASEDIMSLLLVRNIIMYTVVIAILLVAAFGIYNTISTIVMEKTRDIAILKSMGFHARDIRNIFVAEGVIVGLCGSLGGLLAGLGLMHVLGRISIRVPEMPGDLTHLPLDRSPDQFLIAFGFAMVSTVVASFLPARKGARVHPVSILRGAT
ncbi:MAG TPA: ABC transporter permease [Steroidobacteraceae bacterium]|nr:ABC transporter permease [Steroidobacteraceae bacterium]HQZ81434.1 ABC transporter permease [Steroidobacteraceae bacterium]